MGFLLADDDGLCYPTEDLEQCVSRPGKLKKKSSAEMSHQARQCVYINLDR